MVSCLWAPQPTSLWSAAGQVFSCAPLLHAQGWHVWDWLTAEWCGMVSVGQENSLPNGVFILSGSSQSQSGNQFPRADMGIHKASRGFSVLPHSLGLDAGPEEETIPWWELLQRLIAKAGCTQGEVRGTVANYAVSLLQSEYKTLLKYDHQVSWKPKIYHLDLSHWLICCCLSCFSLPSGGISPCYWMGVG